MDHSPSKSVPSTLPKPKEPDVTQYESVANDQGFEYMLTIPLFIVVNNNIFMWNRSKPGYDIISYETFLKETNPVSK